MAGADPWRVVTAYERSRSLGQTMKIDFAPEVDAAYIQLDDAKIVDSEEVLPGVVFDFGACDSIVGVELLAVKKKNPCHLLSLKIPFHNPDEFKAFKSFLVEHAEA